MRQKVKRIVIECPASLVTSVQILRYDPAPGVTTVRRTAHHRSEVPLGNLLGERVRDRRHSRHGRDRREEVHDSGRAWHHINKQVAADRAANGGKLTPAQSQQVNQKQNAASKAIANDKHDEKK